MGERAQFQYQPLTGPVWREPVAERLAWLSQVQQLPRSLPPNRIGGFFAPPFPVVAASFDPQTLDWMPRGTAPRIRVECRQLGDFQQPPFEVLFKSEGLQWQPSDRYAGKPLAYSLQSRWIVDPAPIVTPPFDSQNLEWLASGSLLPYRSLRAIYTGSWVVDPTTPPDQVPPPANPLGPLGPVQRSMLNDSYRPPKKATERLEEIKTEIEEIQEEIQALPTPRPERETFRVPLGELTAFRDSLTSLRKDLQALEEERDTILALLLLLS